MLDFLFIILIFSEIAILYFAIIKILEFEKKINELNAMVAEKGKIINDMHKKINETFKKVNFVLSIITSKRVLQIKRTVSLIISTIEIIIILKTFNYKKGVKFNVKNLKKLLLTGLSKELVKRIINYAAITC